MSKLEAAVSKRNTPSNGAVHTKIASAANSKPQLSPKKVGPPKLSDSMCNGTSEANSCSPHTPGTPVLVAAKAQREAAEHIDTRIAWPPRMRTSA